jgi:hypothetical protein
MEKERVTVEDLFPTAQALFQSHPRAGRRRLRFVAWLALIVSALLVGGQLRSRRRRTS